MPKSSDSLELFTDAAPSVGFRVYLKGNGLTKDGQPNFAHSPSGPSRLRCSNFTQSGLLAFCGGKGITMFCENELVVAMIIKKRSACPTIMSLLLVTIMF